MTHAIRIHETGGPEKMVWEDIPLAVPQARRGAGPPQGGRA